ncbi:MAG: hypothetical protein ABIO70_19640 [Pseudomonadota bacterium]
MSPMPAPPHPRWPLLLALAVLALHLAGGLGWIAWERLVFDGDEAGHVGAAELFMAWWREGRPLTALGQTFAGRLGSYPPLYAGVVGAWWALVGAGDPSSPWVRGLNLLGPLLAAVAVARLAWPLGAWARAVGFAAVLALPLVCGLGRHFMIEGALVAVVAVVVLLGEAARARPTLPRLFAVGLGLGLAFLVKQTAMIYLLPVLALRLPRRPGVLLVPVVGAAVAAPWMIGNLAGQLDYTAESAAGTPGLGLWRHIAFYPWSLLWVGAGPALLVLGGLGAVRGWRAADAATRDRARLAVLWLGASLLILLLVPRKYPRLMAPALPALGLLAAVAAASVRGGRRRWAVPGLLVFGVGWSVAGSLWTLPIPASARVVDERCPQVWLRPAVHDDLGMGAVMEAARRAPEGPVLILGDMEIPCALQTTHSWREHVGPALRRVGLDREIVEEGRAALVLSWEGPVEGYRGHAVVVEGVGASVWIGVRGR